MRMQTELTSEQGIQASFKQSTLFPPVRHIFQNLTPNHRGTAYSKRLELNQTTVFTCMFQIPNQL